MSVISEIYDDLVVLVESVLTDYRRLSNPYELTENQFLSLSSGYAIAVGAGVDTERLVGCKTSWERSFTISLVKKVTTTENNTLVREGFDKELLTDHEKLVKLFYNNTHINDYIVKSSIIDDSGISFIDGDRLQFLAIELNLVIEYFYDFSS